MILWALGTIYIPCKYLKVINNVWELVAMSSRVKINTIMLLHGYN